MDLSDMELKLHDAARSGDSDEVKQVLTKLSSVDRLKALGSKNKDGHTPVHCAAAYGRTETMKCIINSLPPADLYKLLMIEDKYGYTAVHDAAIHGETEIVKSLLAKLTPAQCIEILNIKNDRNMTPLDAARENGQTEIVSYIEEIQKGAEDDVHSQQVDTRDGRKGASNSVDTSNKREDASNSVDTSDKREDASNSVDMLAEVLRDMELGEKLGSGGQATVYKGTWLSTPVAVKVIPDSAGFDLSRTSLEQIEEYQAIKLLRHPNIVQFYGVTQLKEGIGLVMELCDTDLFSLSRSSSSGKSSKELLNIIKDALRGLVYLHSKDIIHMDIKPHNILIQSGRGKLADFGLSDLKENFTDMTVTHSAWSGTALYRAPELLHRAAPSKAADLWCMGLTALQILTGAVPYTEKTRYRKSMVPKDLLEEKLPSSLQQLNPTNQSIFKMVLNFDPNERLSARDWLGKLDDYKF